MKCISEEYLKSILEYDEDTGVFVWKERDVEGFTTGGKLAGHWRPDGRLTISIDGNPYYGHRLAMLYVKGVWPEGHVDHIDGDPSNNRINNLRDCDRFQNLQNSKRRKDNTTGVKGIQKRKDSGMFRPRLYIDGVRTSLGNFKTLEEAQKVLDEAREKNHKQYANKG